MISLHSRPPQTMDYERSISIEMNLINLIEVHILLRTAMTILMMAFVRHRAELPDYGTMHEIRESLQLHCTLERN